VAGNADERAQVTAVVFLGSTIGNFTAGPRADFLARLSAALDPGDCLLLGADLVKDVD